MERNLKRIAVIAGLSIALAGCGGGTIFKQFKLSDGTSITTGARQRVIINSPINPTPTEPSRPGQVNPVRIVCAEPSPDVALAVANSFGLGVSVVSKGSGSVSASQAEGIAQLAERVSTIQLLRDGLYRACEAYANGAISSTVYTLIISRIDDVMVTLLTSELAAGAFGRELAALGTASRATVQASLDEAAKSKAAVERAKKDVEDAEKDVAEKDNAVEKARSDAADPPTTGDQTKIDTADAELEDAKEKLETKLALLKDRAITAADTSARANIVTAAGGITQTTNKDVATVIASMLEEFLNNPSPDTIVAACISELSGQSTVQTKFGSLCEKTLFPAILKGAEQQVKPRHEFKMLRAKFAALKEANQAFAAIARLCGKDSPTDEQKAACTALTKRLPKID